MSALTIASILGIELDSRPVKLYGGGTRYVPAIEWELGYSQGDGACFAGRYRPAADASEKIREHAPSDEELHRIADDLTALAAKYGGNLFSTFKPCGRYLHAYAMDFESVSENEDGDDALTTEDARALKDLIRAFANWIYRAIRAEDEWQSADAQVDDAIRANEYDFLENGKRA